MGNRGTEESWLVPQWALGWRLRLRTGHISVRTGNEDDLRHSYSVIEAVYRLHSYFDALYEALQDRSIQLPDPEQTRGTGNIKSQAKGTVLRCCYAFSDRLGSFMGCCCSSTVAGEDLDVIQRALERELRQVYLYSIFPHSDPWCSRSF